MSAIRSMESQHKQLFILRCKVILVGDAAVGKTALAQVLHSGGHNFPKNYVLTSDADYTVKSLPIEDSNKIVEMHLFDCGGQSIFNQREFGSVYYENANFVVVVYDVDNRESFKSCAKWIQEVASQSPTHQIPGILIANKVDLRLNNNDAISTKEGEAKAEQFGFKYFETSAQEGKGINEPFNYIANEFAQKYDQTVNQLDNLI